MRSEYWALAPTDEIANEIETQWSQYHTWFQSTGARDVVQSLYNCYYSFNDGGFGITKSIDGSSAKIKVQHFKTLIQRIKSLTTQAKLVYNPRAENSDSSTLLRSDFAKGLLDYYADEKDLDSVVKLMTEKGLVCLDSYVYAPWDVSKGDQFAPGQFNGDQVFKVLTRFDVASHTEQESPFFIVRELYNKFDLAALWPQHADAIKTISYKSHQREYITTPFGNRNNYNHINHDMVEVYTLLHDRTPAVPKGRMTMIVGDTVLLDSALKYRTMPIVHFQPGKIFETVLGDSPATALVSLQEAIDALYSAVTTNNLQYSRQNIWSPSPIQVEPLSEGFNNIVSAQKPEALQLVASSPETYNLINTLQSQQQLISGVNSSARGAPESSLKSGNSLALMLSVAIQFVDETQKAYAATCGKLASIVISNLQEFATEPRLAYIGGNSRKSAVKQFTSKDLMGIKLVSADIGNPLTQNIAGRYEIIQQWIQYGVLKDPKKIIEFMRTGQLDSLTEDQFKDSMLIREENEAMRRGENPIVMITDIHPNHIMEHKAVCDDPMVRADPTVAMAVTEHIQAHIDMMKSIDPDLAAILGLQPLPSQQMAMQQPPAPGQEQVPLPEDMSGMTDVGQALPSLPTLPENTPQEFNARIV